MTVQVHDTTRCSLGEGPLWHPTRQKLFWFDIIGKRLHTAGQQWQFSEHVSAAGWIDQDTLLVASETALFGFDLNTGDRSDFCALEADNPVTRSNDGRADPFGGFWIGTMGKNAEPGAGAIYRFFKGELRQLFGSVTISNAICFAPDRTCAYFTDTATGVIQRQALDQTDGWPVGDPEPFLDFSDQNFGPDGAVTDADGNLWNAQWGASRVACYAPDGSFLRAVDLPAAHTSCPAFGGPDLTTLFCTSAAEGIEPEVLAAEPAHGQTFAVPQTARGLAEYQVLL